MTDDGWSSTSRLSNDLFAKDMDFLDDDVFELSVKDDKEAPESDCNPVKEHLMKQLNAIQNRIDKTKNEIEEIKQTVKSILDSLVVKAVSGQETNIDSNDDLYTVEGEPVWKEKCEDTQHPEILVLKSQWQYVLRDKWVIGAVLRNASFQSLYELKFYAFAEGTTELRGISTFWVEVDGLWKRIDSITPKKDDVVATLVLDPLDFDDTSSIDVYGTIAYENIDNELQVALPVVRFTSYDVLRRTHELNLSRDTRYAILALRSTFLETVLELPVTFDTERMAHLLRILSVKRIAKNVYGVDGNTESSLYGMVEVLSLAKIRVSAKTSSYLKLILRTLHDEIPTCTSTKYQEEYCVEAAKALIEELETYLGDPDFARIQRARIKSDLLVP